ncbi:unnamed protein product [Bursaphelenchus okinawaensis]|uniref:Uncharacterized protein n=1 Tax=Bursaphelenchus okinawaensis TaxID=465554 RepID=A0A811KXR2_9BILA|nr:unnamed protein product [Bursaphelenchus okinawaensis]CAG9115134.1 unnamed protein product [Bursaphelenchus okinawaensis]
MQWHGPSVWTVLLKVLYTCQCCAIWFGLCAAGGVMFAFYVKIPNAKNMRKTIEGKMFLQTILLSMFDGFQLILAVTLTTNNLRAPLGSTLALARCSFSSVLYIILNREIRRVLRHVSFYMSGTHVSSSVIAISGNKVGYRRKI